MMSTVIRPVILIRDYLEELIITIQKGKRPGTASSDFLEIWIIIQRNKPGLISQPLVG